MRLAAGISGMRTWSGPTSSGWWLHIDLDVPDGNQFSACAAAGDPAMPGAVVVRAPQKR
jgi:hypothetical protein